MICGVSGKARSGKDQFGEYLIKCFKENYNRNFINMSFALELKMMCKRHFGLSDDQLWGDKKEVPDERFVKPLAAEQTVLNDDDFWTPREIMQEIGSFYRKIYYDFWVKTLDAARLERRYKDVIITDVRHVNECEYVKNNNGVLIRVVREGADKIHGMEHESETALDGFTDFDIEINNNGTLEDLHKAAENAAKAILAIERMIELGGVYHGKS